MALSGDKAPKGTILVVDDMPHNARLLRTYLESDGYRVFETHEAEEGVRLALNEVPDVVLLDIMMPRMDGYEVCRILRDSEQTRGVPIVMITALSGIDDKTRALEVGADDFISKPFNRAEILARVKSLMRIRYYQSLLAEKQKMDAIISDMADGIVVMDARWKIKKINKAAKNLLNLSIDVDSEPDMMECLGRFELSIPPLELMALERPVTSFQIIRSDLDLPLYLAAKLTRVFDLAGRIDSMALTLRDVTDELVSERLQSDFLSFISHKLRTPVTVIKGFLDLFGKNAYGEIPPKLAEAINRVRNKVDELDSLHEKIITYVNCVSLAPEVNPEASLKAAIEKTWPTVKARYKNKHVELNLEMAEGFDTVAIGEEHLAILMDALLDNAVKFADKEICRVEIASRPIASMLELEIRDNGPGIPHEMYDRIFSGFYQCESHFSGNVSGLGIGLVVVKKVIDTYKGDVAVESSLSEGSVFRLRLPLPAKQVS
ncbi:MAG TPA: hybrid sensor histidine kinase/response regulator [Candidatus Brocadiia bacterium]|nr:hybrid sensor histidine kinase/response regulator [Candidatus Brocadiia bacterium]